ncbi:hypothetical protein HN873_040326, partial [Arachis hypogaea]
STAHTPFSPNNYTNPNLKKPLSSLFSLLYLYLTPHSLSLSNTDAVRRLFFSMIPFAASSSK